ncbi:hypothetical protein I7V28_19535 [Lelliottia amnigena]|uniref:hypothetical protein n=1 Tax=Lelliottia amnigena TaxID=61646 RepID=UPI00192C3F7E|nr:hypothetical protein [Lelliottia amnigena]MBL5923275.1 hypothetical protein [Lelliottia amnigena]
MFKYHDMTNYVRAELGGMGIDFDEAEIIASVCHTQSDEVSLSCKLKGSDLIDAVDIYIGTLSTDAPLSAEHAALSKKIKSLLWAYDDLASEEIRIEGKHYASSLVELEPVVDEILAHSADVTQRSGFDLGTYNQLMAVNGEVHIARFALQKFWDTEFEAFVEYLQDLLSENLHRAYETFSSINMAICGLSEYEFTRKINGGLTMNITLLEETDPFGYQDCYMEEVMLPHGKIINKRNNETIINIFNSAADESEISALMRILFTDEHGEEIYTSYSGTYVSKGKNGMLKIANRTSLLREAFHELRNILTPPASMAA